MRSGTSYQLAEPIISHARFNTGNILRKLWMWCQEIFICLFILRSSFLNACLNVLAFIMVMATRKIDWLEHVSCSVSGYKLRNGRDDVIFILT